MDIKLCKISANDREVLFRLLHYSLFEYEINKTYADDKVEFSKYLKSLREEIRKDTLKKLGE